MRAWPACPLGSRNPRSGPGDPRSSGAGGGGAGHPPAKRESAESPERPREPGPPSAGGTSARARQGGAAARRCDARFTWRGVGLQGVASGGTPRARALQRDREGRSGLDLRGGCMPTAFLPAARPQPLRPPPASRDLPAAPSQDLDYLPRGCCAISSLSSSQMPGLESRARSPRYAHSHISRALKSCILACLPVWTSSPALRLSWGGLFVQAGERI